MNESWAIEQLTKFINLTQSSNASSGNVFTTRSVANYPREIVLEQWAIVEQILKKAYPIWRNTEAIHGKYEFGQQRDAAIHAKSLLENQREIESNLKPEGPTFYGENLHPLIWQPASLLWTDGHYRSAVQAACVALDNHLQDFVKRNDISGTDLVNQSFSGNAPGVGKPRIRVPEQSNSETTKSLQNGMRSLGEACFTLARNLSTHSLADLAEQDGLERLAMLSQFTKILETCNVVTE